MGGQANVPGQGQGAKRAGPPQAQIAFRTIRALDTAKYRGKTMQKCDI